MEVDMEEAPTVMEAIPMVATAETTEVDTVVVEASEDPEVMEDTVGRTPSKEPSLEQLWEP